MCWIKSGFLALLWPPISGNKLIYVIFILFAKQVNKTNYKSQKKTKGTVKKREEKMKDDKTKIIWGICKYIYEIISWLMLLHDTCKLRWSEVRKNWIGVLAGSDNERKMFRCSRILKKSMVVEAVIPPKTSWDVWYWRSRALWVKGIFCFLSSS